CGFAATLGVFGIWILASGAGPDFWRNAVMLNMFYIDSEPVDRWFKFMARRGLGYVLFNAALWVPAIVSSLHALRSVRTDPAGESNKDVEGVLTDPARESNNSFEVELETRAHSEFLLAVTLWALVSLSAVLLSGRFFGHYFIPALPALAMLAADRLRRWLREIRSGVASMRKRLGFAFLGLIFVFGVVRFHQRTAILAYETLTGRITARSQKWGMSKREREAEVVSQFVASRLRSGEPLYIWGYAHDVYWKSGCRPASRYLTPYYIDGRFPDAEAVSAPPQDRFWAQARENLIADLSRNRPRMILEVYGGIRELPY